MSFKRILPADIFVWKALPSKFNSRITFLPKGFPFVPSPAIGLEQVDNRQLAEDTKKAIESLSHYPEQHFSGNEFMDEFARLIHRYGIRSSFSFASMMSVDAKDFCGTVKALSGISAQKWISEYVMLMINDLMQRTDLTGEEIRKLIYPRSHQALSQFIKRNKKG